VIETAIEAICVNIFISKLHQIGKSPAAVPILGDPQLARRLETRQPSSPKRCAPC
jgi:hypothetical protein